MAADGEPGVAAYAYLLGGAVAWGSGVPASKIVTGAFPRFLASLLRVAAGALLLAPILWMDRDEVAELDRRGWLRVAAVGVLGVFGFTLLMLHGMRFASGVLGSLVLGMAPAVTGVGAFLLLDEHASWPRVLALALAALGVAGVHVADALGVGGGLGPRPLLGSFLVLGAVVAESAFTLVGKELMEDDGAPGRGGLHPASVAGLASVVALPLFVPGAVLEVGGFEAGRVAWYAWAALLWWGAGTLALGSVLWYRGVERVAGSTAAGFVGAMPVAGIVLSYVVLGEAFRWVHVLGAGLVLAGIALLAWADHTRCYRGL